MRNWKHILLGIISICLGLTGAVMWSAIAQYTDLLSRMSLSEEKQIQESPSVTYRENVTESPLFTHRENSWEPIDMLSQKTHRGVPETGPEISLPLPKQTERFFILEKDEKLKPFILLLYGLDKRKQNYDRGRPDTLMLALFHPNLNGIQLISLPRDAYVPIPGHGHHKLNHSFSKGGASLTIKTIEKWLNINIKGYAAIDFAGFVKLIDLLGGININVERDMDYDDPEDGTSIHLKQGEQLLNGEKVLQYVRFRYSNHGSADSDYKRMERQQEVLKQIAKKTTGIPSLIKLLAIKRVMEEHIQTTLTPSEINSLIRWLIKAEHPQIENTSMVGQGKYERRQWFEIISEEEKKRIQTIIKEFMDAK